MSVDPLLRGYYTVIQTVDVALPSLSAMVGILGIQIMSCFDTWDVVSMDQHLLTQVII